MPAVRSPDTCPAVRPCSGVSAVFQVGARADSKDSNDCGDSSDSSDSSNFSDFNFKLLVIEGLMHCSDALVPRFGLTECPGVEGTFARSTTYTSCRI
ncbi:hypothetical protein ABT025_28440 [Streptomyces sp. NPDC002809]|uniref:DUF6892 domain-containing protein n=1 Tax=Streptomyces sp. NPDC002809 TaxID=3154433 RepID=UPI00332D97F2